MKLLGQDRAHILNLSRDVFGALEGARVFITGGTGFFGKWLLSSLSAAHTDLGSKIEACVLTRDPEKFCKANPLYAGNPQIKFAKGDVQDFKFPEGAFSHVIHAATPADAVLSQENPALMTDIIVKGTERAWDFFKTSQAEKFLLTSSGAVYGAQPPQVSHLKETDPLQAHLLSPRSAYADGKVRAEEICLRGDPKGAIVTRSFAFIGPELPMDGVYAAGNFMRDALKGGPIRIGGDGTPLRSYLYAADLAIWLWTLLVKGKPGDVINVGSDQAVSIAELAQAIAKPTQTKIEIAKTPVPGAPLKQYVPSIKHAREAYGLSPWIDLEESVARTREFFTSI